MKFGILALIFVLSSARHLIGPAENDLSHQYDNPLERHCRLHPESAACRHHQDEQESLSHKNKIGMSGITVYGNDFCPVCKKLSTYLTNQKIPFSYIDTKTEQGQEKRSELAKQYNWSTIPLVLVDDKFIGGCDEFLKKLNNKEITLPSL